MESILHQSIWLNVPFLVQCFTKNLNRFNGQTQLQHASKCPSVDAKIKAVRPCLKKLTGFHHLRESKVSSVQCLSTPGTLGQHLNTSGKIHAWNFWHKKMRSNVQQKVLEGNVWWTFLVKPNVVMSKMAPALVHRCRINLDHKKPRNVLKVKHKLESSGCYVGLLFVECYIIHLW